MPLISALDSDEPQAAVPSVLISHDTLLYLGLSERRAQSLWEEWTSWPSLGPWREVDADDGNLRVYFIDFVLGHFNNIPSTHGEDDASWRLCLALSGISWTLLDAIMDSDFKDLRLTANSVFWIKDTIQMRYAGLEHILSGGFRPKPAVDQGRTAGLFNAQGQVADVSRLLTRPPPDFGGVRSLFYFTDDLHVAEHHAAYAKRRANGGPICIVAVTIPRTQITQLFKEDDEEKQPRAYSLCYPSPQWEQVVWRSKRSQPISKPLRKYRDAVLLVGTAATGATDAYQAMDHWEEVDERCVLRPQGSEATQYVFSAEEEGHEFLLKQRFDVFHV
ncbi:hypothetical protein Micbo1qcDRAFT_206428 [Microdochium bolleyi]|uniref:Uncharacterized protein n=1 Tax=Microdochium bolleyi TaxID=196109 RepID=A0A136IX34_9PEZI|nr:hypothetical protein Micbo1qcDRAFT_206428 [Microdochium bolleyi]